MQICNMSEQNATYLNTSWLRVHENSHICIQQAPFLEALVSWSYKDLQLVSSLLWDVQGNSIVLEKKIYQRLCQHQFHQFFLKPFVMWGSVHQQTSRVHHSQIDLASIVSVLPGDGLGLCSAVQKHPPDSRYLGICSGLNIEIRSCE